MALFVLADLHLSFGADKPMDHFYGWKDHVKRLQENWKKKVKPEDTVVLPGDISWAKGLEEARPDFEFIHKLPGEKIILKGNHDYWWTTRKKIEDFWENQGFTTLRLLHNNAFLREGVALCGSRGWFFDCEGVEDRKILLREAGRLRASIQEGKRLSEKLCVFLHYPPLMKGQVCAEIMDVLCSEEISCCYYGHLHGQGIRRAFSGDYCSIHFELVSADFLQFSPFEIRKMVKKAY